MADEESKLQTEILKKQASDINEQNTAIKDLLKQAREQGVSAKEQLKLVKTQQQLEKSQATLAKDLSKNFDDLKGGLVSQVEGFSASILGPFSGVANSLTTGFFKRKKQNDENISQNEALIEQAKEQAEKMGGLVEKTNEGNQYLKVIADGVPTAEELEEAKKNGGVVDVPEPTEEEKGGFGMMLLKFLGIVLAAAAGLAAGAAAGIVTYLTDIIKMIGKPIIKLLDAIPRPKFIDNIIDMFKAEGMVGKLFTNIKGFFVGEGTFFKRIGISKLYFSFNSIIFLKSKGFPRV